MAQRSHLHDYLPSLIALASPAHRLSTPYTVTPGRAYAGTTRLPRLPSSVPCAVQSRVAHSEQGYEWTPRCAGEAHQLPSVATCILAPALTAPWYLSSSLYSNMKSRICQRLQMGSLYAWSLARNICYVVPGRRRPVLFAASIRAGKFGVCLGLRRVFLLVVTWTAMNKGYA